MSVCGWDDRKWPIRVRICRQQPFYTPGRAQPSWRVREEMEQDEIKWNTTCFQWRGKLLAYLSFLFFLFNTYARPNEIWYKEGLISLQGTLVEKHWEISFISALSGLPAVKQQQAHSAFSPKPPVTRVRGLPVSTSDWMLWFVFVIRCEPGSQWQKWQLFAFNMFLLLHGSYKALCLCLPRTTARHCRDAPKSFIYEHCDIEGSAAVFLFLN